MRVMSSRRHLSPRTKAAGACVNVGWTSWAGSVSTSLFDVLNGSFIPLIGPSTFDKVGHGLRE